MGLSDREWQILNWIEQNPMISQNELAHLAGITRSGVASHITNLVKKGYLRGKGYIVARPRSTVIIGGVSLDVRGVIDGEVEAHSSNHGTVQYMIGGVGRNVAVAAATLGMREYFITVYGDDHNGELFKNDAAEAGVDITYSAQIRDEVTASYLYIDKSDGGRVVALNDMGINDAITADFLSDRIDALNQADMVFVDCNVPERTLVWICEHCSAPIVARTASRAKASRLLPILDRLAVAVIDGGDAPELAGLEIADRDDAERCVSRLLARGLPQVLIVDCGLGVAYGSQDGQGFIPLDDSRQVDANGASDVAAGVLMWAKSRGLPFEECCRYAAAGARLGMEHREMVGPWLSPEALESSPAA